MPEHLRTHGVILTGKRVVLRPMTEDDWPTLLRWNQDPDVLYFAEGDAVQSHTLAEVQAIYRGVSQRAYCFLAELTGLLRQGELIGEGWLQEMNLARLLDRFPGEDLRRIDLMIGDKGLWGRGLGTEIIGLLTQYAFDDPSVDRVFGCDIADYNARSLRAFEKNGYELLNYVPQPPGHKAQVVYDVMLTRERYWRRKSGD